MHPRSRQLMRPAAWEQGWGLAAASVAPWVAETAAEWALALAQAMAVAWGLAWAQAMAVAWALAWGLGAAQAWELAWAQAMAAA